MCKQINLIDKNSSFVLGQLYLIFYSRKKIHANYLLLWPDPNPFGEDGSGSLA